MVVSVQVDGLLQAGAQPTADRRPGLPRPILRVADQAIALSGGIQRILVLGLVQRAPPRLDVAPGALHPARGHPPDVASFTLGAFAIILDEQWRVLLCHRRDHDLWNLPGGAVERGEAPWEAVLREVREEVRLHVRIDRLVGIYSKPEQDEVVFSFRCSVTDGVPAPTDEADQVAYFAAGELPRNTLPKQVERIADALAPWAGLILKTQVGPASVELLREGKL